MTDKPAETAGKIVDYLQGVAEQMRGPLTEFLTPQVTPPPPVVTPPSALPPRETVMVTEEQAVALFKPGTSEAIENIDFVATKPGQRGVYVLRGFDSVTIRNCTLRGFTQNIVFAVQGGERVKDAVIRDVSIWDITPGGGMHPQGLYSWGVDYGFAYRLNIDGAASRPATVFDHDIYAAEGNGWWTFTDCITANASSHGFQVRCSHSINNSVMLDCPIPYSGGGGDEPVAGGVEANMHDCLIRGGGDIGSDPRGIATWLSNIKGGEIARNIICDGTGGDQKPLNLDAGKPGTAGVHNLLIQENIRRGWGGSIGMTGTAEQRSGTTIADMEERADLVGIDVSHLTYAPDFYARLRVPGALSGADYLRWARERMGA